MRGVLIQDPVQVLLSGDEDPVNTVKSYLQHVMRKLAARNRAQLITNARRSGLL